MRHKFAVLLLLVLGVSAGTITACGDDSSSSNDSSDTTSSSKVSAQTQQVLDRAWEGDIQPPPTSGPKAIPNKDIWVTAAVGFEANKVLVDAFSEAADEIGWNVEVKDNKGDPNQAVSQMRQAVSAGADGIVMMPFDCPVTKAGLTAAKNAGIPVVNYAGLDCDFKGFGGNEPAMFAAPLKLFGTENFEEYYKILGKRDADFMLAALEEQGVENPKILQTQNLDLTLNRTMAKEFEARIKEKCPGCTLEPVEFTLPQVVDGSAQQVFRSAMLANPDADALHFAWDAQLTGGGLATALQTSPQDWKLICCGDGTTPSVELTRSGLADRIVLNKYPYEWYAWGLADVLNRVFAGEEKNVPNQGTLIFYADKEHNLSESGDTVEYPIDYAQKYKDVWTGK